MATITAKMANAWTDSSKLNITTIDTELESQIVAQVFSKLRGLYDTTTWVEESTTPKLVKSILSMIYTGMVYNKTYAVDGADTDLYGNMLIADANKLLDSVSSGVSVLVDSNPAVTIVASSDNFSVPFFAVESSDTEPKFSMDTEW